jgi:four helix bundle protein
MRRSALSIPSNVAEGYGRKTTPEYLRFLSIAYGSTCELETQLLLSGDLGYLDKESLSGLQRDIGEVERMTKALIKSLENKHLTPGILEPFLPNNWEKSLIDLVHSEIIAVSET